MKTIGIAKIKPTNPVLASYVKKIRAWDEEKKFEINKDSLYGIFLDDQFLAASTMQYDPETSNVNILMINGSNQNYDRIQEESTEQLTVIALEEYKTDKVNVKKIGIR